MVVYDAMPCLDDRHDLPTDTSHLLDFSDVVVSAYRLTNDHPRSLHILLSSDESLYRDGGYYGKNRKLVEEVYYLTHRYLVVRCADVLGKAPNSLLDRLLDYRPLPYTLDTTLQFVGVQSVVDLVCSYAFELVYPTVLTAAGTGCVLVYELCDMAGVIPVVTEYATKMARDCDSSQVSKMVALKSSKEYAREYIQRRLTAESALLK